MLFIITTKALRNYTFITMMTGPDILLSGERFVLSTPTCTRNISRMVDLTALKKQFFSDQVGMELLMKNIIISDHMPMALVTAYQKYRNQCMVGMLITIKMDQPTEITPA